MIALRDGFPLVTGRAGLARSFRPAWLRQALRRAAQRAGYGNWWIARDLADSVSVFLERRYQSNTIAKGRLEELVRQALRDIGYHDVARLFGSKASLTDPCQLSFCL